MAKPRVYAFHDLTGGGAGALDAIDTTGLADDSLAYGIHDAYGFLAYLFDSASLDPAAPPDVIQPLTGPGRWKKQEPLISYVPGYATDRQLELELMKMNFQSISWAQFAVYEDFSDEAKRAVPDPSPTDARVWRGSLDNGGDLTPGREFGFVSKTYANITTVETGTATGVGLNYLTDSAKNWFADECKNLTLLDSLGTEFAVTGNTADTLTVSGTPAAGAYSLRDDLPQFAVAFCSYEDATNGGYGYAKMEVSFDAGAHYQTFLDTEAGVDVLGATVAIANPGRDYVVRATLKNDGDGDGARIHKFLVCTDPAPWRF